MNMQPLKSGSANHSPSRSKSRTSVVVSPEDDSVYVTAENDAAILQFDRSAGGALTYEGCITGKTFAFLGTPPNGCVPVADATTNGANTGFDSLHGAYAAPDGRTVYAASPTDASIVSFERAGDGSLTLAGCFRLRRVKKSIDEGGTATVLRLEPQRRTGRRILRLLRRGGKLRARIAVRFTDEAGNSTTEKRGVRLVMASSRKP
jgi:hypothetical protein